MTAPQPYLPAVIDWVQRGMAMARKIADLQGDPFNQCNAYNDLIDQLGQRMKLKFGAHIGKRGDLVQVQACGVVATSVQGLNGALRNWIAAAERKIAVPTTETLQ